MKYLLSDEGRARLETLTHEPALYAFDFDGTLARIVRERQAARLAPEVRRCLIALGRLAPTAVISGRSLADLRRRVAVDIPYLVGNHGMEDPETPTEVRLHARQVCESWKQQLQGGAAEQLAELGVQIEDKGYSLTFHYRLSAQKPRARSVLFEWVGRLTPSPRLVLGKAVVNAVPPGMPHKGAALLSLIHRANVSQALYVGDDDTDEDVFTLPDTRLLTVRVGIKQASHAQFYLRSQAEMTILLQELVRALSQQTSAHSAG